MANFRCRSFVDISQEHPKLTCNTEKDRIEPLHRRTAGTLSFFGYNNFEYIIHVIVCCSFQGVLAGLWPCGIVVMLSELFSAESKSQVFAALYELLSNNRDALNDLSKDANVYYVQVPA